MIVRWGLGELPGVLGELGGTPTESPDPAAAEMVVNTTAVGLRGEDPF